MAVAGHSQPDSQRWQQAVGTAMREVLPPETAERALSAPGFGDLAAELFRCCQDRGIGPGSALAALSGPACGFAARAVDPALSLANRIRG